MNYREFGSIGWSVSEISFGAWAIGSAWGPVDDKESLATLHRAIDLGVNFIDTADVYGDGHSERLIAQVRKDRSEPVYVATKAGRRLSPHTADVYNHANLSAFIDRSLKNLNTERLDLVQLHCPPTDVYYRPEVFEALDRIRDTGKIQHYGVSVEKVEEALKAIEYPGVRSVQIIFNAFRLRPSALFFREAKARNIAIIARVPLASGLLTGRITQDTTFAADDHRTFNRFGEQFDRGETFSGVDLDRALAAVEELRNLVPAGSTLAQFALKWVLMHPAVSCAIPGAKRPAQLEENVGASHLAPLTPAQMDAVISIYERLVAPQVHHRW